MFCLKMIFSWLEEKIRCQLNILFESVVKEGTCAINSHCWCDNYNIGCRDIKLIVSLIVVVAITTCVNLVISRVDMTIARLIIEYKIGNMKKKIKNIE